MGVDATSWGDLLWVIIAFAIAMWLIASAFAGHDRARLGPAERALRFALGLLALAPQMIVAGPAIALSLALIARHAAAARKSDHDQRHKNERGRPA
jgi:TRAP-type uncharacterized transport system fused permease subunit